VQVQLNLPKEIARSFEAFKLSLEKTTNPIRNNTNIIEIAFFLKLKNMKFVLTFFLTMIYYIASYINLE